MSNSKRLIVSVLLLSCCALAQIGGGISNPPLQNPVDIRYWYNASGSNGLTPDFGLAIANVFAKYGSGVSIDYSGLCPTNGGGIVTVYGNTNPWHSQGVTFSSYHRLKCSIQWITSVTVNTPPNGNTELVAVPSSGNTNLNAGFSFEPCVAAAGCGPNSYPQFPINLSGLGASTYTSGGSITGTIGQTCTLTLFNNGMQGATATVALTGTNVIAGGTSLTITNTGYGGTTVPTSATLGSGTATCSGTATLSTTFNGNPVAGTAVAAGPPAPAPTTYTTGTATFTNGSAAVTGSGTAWTSAMVGGWIYSGTGVQANACVGYIQSVNSATSITVSNQFNANCTIAAGSGVAGTYTILQPNALVLLWVCSGSIEVGGAGGAGLNNNGFNQRFEQFRVDQEGLPFGIGKYTTNCQENYTDFGSADNLNAGHQGASNHGFADASTSYRPPLAGTMFDNYYASTAGTVTGGAAQSSIYDVTINFTSEPAANCGNGNSYGFVYQGWSFMNGVGKGALNNAYFSTVNGTSTCNFTDNAYIDAAQGGTFNFGHMEYGANSGVHLGANNATYTTVNLGRAANFANGIPHVLLDTNASFGNRVCVGDNINNKVLIKDVMGTTAFNGAQTVSTASASNIFNACYDQTNSAYFRGIYNFGVLSLNGSLTGSQAGPFLNLTGTWNTTGVVDAGIFVNVTNTASGSGSALLDLQASSTSAFAVKSQAANSFALGPNLTLNGTAPAITATGTTPFLNFAALIQGNKNTCDWALTAQASNAATSLCSTLITLPGAATKFHFWCSGVWQVSASTTPTVTMGITFAQAPSATGLVAGTIWASNGTISTAPIGISGSVVSLASGNNNIVAAQTISAAATYFPFTLNGWFTSNATSGTWSPTITVGTSASTWASAGECKVF